MADGIPEGECDLFGLPLLPERGRGRPAHVWTKEISNRVNLLFAAEKTPMEVARAIGLSKPTFYKHYFNEIARAGYAPLMMTGVQLERLNAEAEKGNVTAEKALAALLDRERVRSAESRVKARGGGKREPKPVVLGKKEQARVDATNVGGKFRTRTPPPSLIN